MGSCFSSDADDAPEQGEDETKSQKSKYAAYMKYLPVVKYLALELGTEEECCYCLDLLRTGDLVIVLPCIHLFHFTCMKEWLISKFVCPLCRHDVYTGITDAQKSVRFVEKLCKYLEVAVKWLKFGRKSGSLTC